MDKVDYQGKLLVFRIVATLLVLLFFTLPSLSSISYSVGIIMVVITLIIFFVLENIFNRYKKE